MLKVLTLNVNGYGETHGSWRSRREVIAAVIEEADPAVVALQAVRREPNFDGGLDQAAQLARLVSGYPYVIFQPAAVRPDGGAEGLAFISRHPALETGSLHFSLARGEEDPSRRMIFHASFSVRGENFRLFNAHFSWIPHQNEGNVREARTYLRSFDGSALLVGDFNTAPGTDGLRGLEGDGWSDLWSHLRPGEDGFTFPSDEPEKRIDFIWARGAHVEAARTIEVRTAPEEAGGIHLSDHLGVLATVEEAA